MLALLLFTAACFLAFSNGANDNIKGVATLFGSDTTDYRTAILWATATTLLGSLTSLVVAGALVETFSGQGLVPDAIASGELFLLAVGAGAGGTVMLATLTGFPISTTHSLVGGLVGAGAWSAGAGLDFAVLGSSFVLPLLASPLLALLAAGALYVVLRRARVALALEEGDWVCVGEGPVSRSSGTDGSGSALEVRASVAELAVGRRATCDTRYAGRFVGFDARRLLDSAHFLSGGLVGFARGLNDTPKIAALLVALEMVDVRFGTAVLAVAMAAGGLLGARKVAVTMGRRITGMNAGQGFAANLTTAVLVIGASRLGLPVSTTHVSVGSLFGIGILTGRGDPKVIRKIVLAWVVTLPCAAGLAALVYGVGSSLF